MTSRIDPRDDEFCANDAANRAAVEKLRAALAEATVGGGERYTSRHRAAGKLLPRERIELLLDRDAYFLELAPLAGIGVQGHTPGAGAIGGIGVVSGTECVIWANDSTVKGGAGGATGALAGKDGTASTHSGGGGGGSGRIRFNTRYGTVDTYAGAVISPSLGEPDTTATRAAAPTR